MQELRDFIGSRQKMNLIIVAANIVVFLVLSILGDTEDTRFMLEHLPRLSKKGNIIGW